MDFRKYLRTRLRAQRGKKCQRYWSPGTQYIVGIRHLAAVAYNEAFSTWRMSEEQQTASAEVGEYLIPQANKTKLEQFLDCNPSYFGLIFANIFLHREPS